MKLLLFKCSDPDCGRNFYLDEEFEVVHCVKCGSEALQIGEKEFDDASIMEKKTMDNCINFLRNLLSLSADHYKANPSEIDRLLESLEEILFNLENI